MICQNVPRDGRATPGLGESSTESPVAARIYDRRFWFAFVANLCIATAIALLFRYADLVRELGGGEFELGWIVGVGMVGSIAIRLALGRAIDRHGARAVWLVSLALFAASCFGHLLLRSCHGPEIYALRILFASAVAGIFGASITWISARAPKARTAEVVGMLGASGFIAWALGNYLGDLLSAGSPHVARLFVAAGSFALVSLFFCWLATAGTVQRAEPANGSMARMLWRYSRRAVLLVGVATGLVIGLPMTFLRTFNVELGITSMASFFAVYAAVALVVRITARRFPERFGLAPVILMGLVLMAGGLLSFLIVEHAWQLAIPAMILGAAHAVVFPPTIAASTLSFPEHCRGLGTMLILAACDLGTLIGSPLAGVILKYSKHVGLRPYPTMFVTMACIVGVIIVIFAASLFQRRSVSEKTNANDASDASDAIGQEEIDEERLRLSCQADAGESGRPLTTR